MQTRVIRKALPLQGLSDVRSFNGPRRRDPQRDRPLLVIPVLVDIIPYVLMDFERVLGPENGSGDSTPAFSRRAVGCKPSHLSGQVLRLLVKTVEFDPCIAHELQIAEEYLVLVHTGPDAMARHGQEGLRARELYSLHPRPLYNGLPQRMLGALLGRRGEAQQVARRDAIDWHEVGHLRLALR